MSVPGDLDFSHVCRREIYDYVERHGTTDPETARRDLDMDPSHFGLHVTVLKRDGVLEEDEDGQLRVAFEEATAEEHTTGEVEFVIRQARQEDLTGLVGAMRSVVEDQTYCVAESVAEIVDHEQVLLRHNELSTRVFFVATVGGEVVGWVHVSAPTLEKLAHTAELTVGVLEDYRGHGIGSHLLVRGVGWAAANGYEKIYNSVPSTNERAVAFLEEHGWEIEAVREDHYLIDGEHVDEVMLAVRV